MGWVFWERGKGGRRPANWGFGWIKKKKKKKPINIPSRTTHSGSWARYEI